MFGTKKKLAEVPYFDPEAELRKVSEEERLEYWRAEAARRDFGPTLTPKLTAFIPHTPSVKQAAFLLLPNREALYGGAAGGGKSDAVLMAALQYVDVPRYSALILRRSFADLALPGAIMDRARDWLQGKAKWNDAIHTFSFVSGAKLSFGYCESMNDVRRYKSAEFQFIGIDELTEFAEPAYRFLFTRLRRPAEGPLSKVPLRMRGASNPGGPGHEWVKRRFIVEGASAGRAFIPAKFRDNPYLDHDEYELSLNELDPVSRAHYLNGDWSARAGGKLFRREWFSDILDHAPVGIRRIRYWDLAGTEASKKNRDPDWTVGALVGELRGKWVIMDIVRFRGRPQAVEGIVRQTALVDGRDVPVYIEQEPGQSGLYQIHHYQKMLGSIGVFCEGDRATGEKQQRWQPVSSAAESGNIMLCRGEWNGSWLDESEAAPYGSHDDQLDAVAGACAKLAFDVMWTEDL